MFRYGNDAHKDAAEDAVAYGDRAEKVSEHLRLIDLAAHGYQTFIAAVKKGIFFLSLPGAHDLDDVAVLQFGALLDPHPAPGVDGVEEALADLGMDAEGEVLRGRAPAHQEGVREDTPLLVGAMVLVLHRVGDGLFVEFEDRPG